MDEWNKKIDNEQSTVKNFFINFFHRPKYTTQIPVNPDSEPSVSGKFHP